MIQILDKAFTPIKWILLLGTMGFCCFPFMDREALFAESAVTPGLLIVFLLAALFLIYLLLLRNREMVILSLVFTGAAYCILTGVGLFFRPVPDRALLIILLFPVTLVVGAGGALLLKYRKSEELFRTGFRPVIQVSSLGILLAGFTLLGWFDGRMVRITGFILVSLSILHLFTLNLIRISFDKFFTARRERGLWPLTFSQIFMTLWTYFILVIGSLLLGITGAVVLNLPLGDRERRQLHFHRGIMYFCRFFLWAIPIKIRLIKPGEEDFINPAIIICNHQSLIDMPLLFRLYPRLIILTNDWVYHSPLFGLVSKLGNYYNVSDGIDPVMDKLKSRVEAGYSIIVFPEGTRSPDLQIHRFHKGAFYIAEKLQLDILPVLIVGTGDLLRKSEFWGRPRSVIQKILPRIPPDDPSFGADYSRRPKPVRQLLTREYEKLKQQTEQ